MALNNLFWFTQRFLVSVGIGVLSLVNWVKNFRASGSSFIAWLSLSFRGNCNESYSFFSRIGSVLQMFVFISRSALQLFSFKTNKKNPPKPLGHHYRHYRYMLIKVYVTAWVLTKKYCVSSVLLVSSQVLRNTMNTVFIQCTPVYQVI